MFSRTSQDSPVYSSTFSSLSEPALPDRAILDNSDAHHFCVEKKEKLSGSRLSKHLKLYFLCFHIDFWR